MRIVLIISDTLRWDHLGAAGNPWIHTPNLDRLAAESMVFEHAYTGSFPTIPHRVDLLTGRWVYPFRGWAPLPTDEPVLAEILTQAGYTTMLVNDTPHLCKENFFFQRGYLAWKWNRGQEGDRSITDDIPVELPCAPEKIRGPERMRQYHYRWRARHWQSERDTFVARTMQDAADWIEANYRRPDFFLHVDTFDPHEPWDPPAYYVDRYDRDYKGECIDHPPYTWVDRMGASPEEVRHAKALYAGEVSLVDTWVGRLLEKLELCGILEDTLVIFHSDHGFNVGDHDRFGKNCHDPGEMDWPFFEEVSHVPLMIRAPGGPRGRSHPFLAQAVDIMPTILEMAGVDPPPTIKGYSLTPALRSNPMPERPVVLTTRALVNPSPHTARQTTAITDGTWTLHYRGNENPWELFNIESDPGQERDLAATARSQAERLHAAHLEQMRLAGVSEEVIALRDRLP